MQTDWVNLITAITSLLSVLIAVVALIVAIRSEARSGKHFEHEMSLQERVAQASVKPILAVFTSEFANNKGIVLSNAGVGTAVITKIDFIKGDKTTKALPELFQLPSNVRYDNHWRFGTNKHYLIAGKSIDLIRLTAENLRQQGLSDSEQQNVLKAWQEQMPEITIKIEYEDVFGNKQEDSGRTL